MKPMRTSLAYALVGRHSGIPFRILWGRLLAREEAKGYQGPPRIVRVRITEVAPKQKGKAK